MSMGCSSTAYENLKKSGWRLPFKGLITDSDEATDGFEKFPTRLIR